MGLLADSIYYNGSVYTMDEENRIFNALAVKDGKILSIGNDNEILSLKGEKTKLFDLKGKAVIPGLVDTHSHFARTGLSELTGELFMPQSVEELLEGVRQRVKDLPAGKGLHLKNIYPTRLKEWRYPTLEELDEAAPNNPVFADGAFAGQANSMALEVLGLSDKRIMKDSQGKPTGIIVQPFDLAKKLSPPQDYGIEDYCKAIENMQACYNRYGITSAIEGSTDELTVRAANHLYSEGKLNIRLVYTNCIRFEEEAASEKEFMENIIRTPDDWGKLSFTKIMLDGGILTGTSYMREPYDDKMGVFGINTPGFRGLVNYDADQVVKIIAAVDKLNLQMTAHSIGDGATDILLDAYERYNKTNPISGKRFSIIHCDFTDQQVLEKIRDLGIHVIFQPAWHFKDAAVLEKTLSRRTMSTFLPYKSYLDMGIIAAGGSDHMVKYDSMLSQNPYNPFMALYNMVTRRTVDGAVVQEDQKVSREQALRTYTCNGAYVSFDEKVKGNLSVGKQADFAVLTKDYFTCPEDEIPKLESVLTVVGGKIVYSDIG